MSNEQLCSALPCFPAYATGRYATGRYATGNCATAGNCATDSRRVIACFDFYVMRHTPLQNSDSQRLP